MWKSIQKYSVHRFFILYNMLHYRKYGNSKSKRKRTITSKIMDLGYFPIFTTLKYIQYDHLYRKLVSSYGDFNQNYFFEESINISYETRTGICITYKNEPIDCVRLIKERGMYNRKMNIRYYLAYIGFHRKHNKIADDNNICSFIFGNFMPVRDGYGGYYETNELFCIGNRRPKQLRFNPLIMHAAKN